NYWNVLIGQGTYFDPSMIENGTLRKYTGYTTDIITDLCLDWLKNRDQNKPFCLLCHHKAPHYICEPDDKHENMYSNTIFPEPGNFNDNSKGRVYPKEIDWNISDLHIRFKNNPRWSNVPEELTPVQRKSDNYQRFMKDMLRTVASVDDNVGRLLDHLDKVGLRDNTIVVYVSDNGYFIGEHGWIDKKVPYDESIRTPLLVRFPERIKPGSVNDDFVLNTDFAPTLLDYAGVPIPAVMQGRSFRPLLEGRLPKDWRTSIYIQFYIINRFPYYGIRTKRYKLVYFYDEVNDWEFYDLAKDPDEINNAYSDPAYEDVITKLKSELMNLRKEVHITNELEQEFIEKSGSNVWRTDMKRYIDNKMIEWKGNSSQ
ncbi:MAG TPA: DUF4976 domain-containing protein, partial [bacterium]|nr:DUF4976 domain-containing protein [bacterium]